MGRERRAERAIYEARGELEKDAGYAAAEYEVGGCEDGQLEREGEGSGRVGRGGGG